MLSSATTPSPSGFSEINLRESLREAALALVRPSKVLFMANTPANCTENDLIVLVSPFAKSLPVVRLDQTRGTALVEFGSEQEATRCLSYFLDTGVLLQGVPVVFAYSRAIAGKEKVEGSRVLLVHVSNLMYPVTVEMLHQIFSKYGMVERIVTFQKEVSVFQALVQMDSVEHAAKALTALDNENIYTGCNNLRVHFSNFHEVSVKFNNSRTRDYTNPDLPTGSDDVVLGLPIESQTSMRQAQVPSVDASVSSVVIVYRLGLGATVEGLFNLFSFYGHVCKIKFMHSKPDTALVQFLEPVFAALAMQFLEGAQLWGSEIHLDYAKMREITLPNEGLPDGTEIANFKFRAYSMRERRFGSNLPERVVKSACKPTAVLHIANLSLDVTESNVRDLLGDQWPIIGFKWLASEGSTRMALLLMKNVQVATACLMLAHNLPLKDRQLKISFSKAVF